MCYLTLERVDCTKLTTSYVVIPKQDILELHCQDHDLDQKESATEFWEPQQNDTTYVLQ